MARYIDADALYKETEKKIAEANSYRMAVVDGEFLDLINDAETEDVVPKSEVALEVIRKVKNKVRKYKQNVVNPYEHIMLYLNELEKKYTEGNK
jgi:hypothetical protein